MFRNLLKFKMAAETAVKRVKTDPRIIGTHNGHFHADEALAVYMLRLLPDYASASLIRTRDPGLLDTCHTVVDVGGEYDVSKNRYDHHQRTFDTAFPDHKTKLSSAGLVYMHFGKAIIAQHTKLPIDHPDVDLLYRKLYDDFVEAIDANDNGISKYDDALLEKAGIEKRFKDGGITLPSLVNDMNHEDPLALGTPSRNTEEEPQAEEDYRFSQASALMGKAFLRKLHGAATAWLPARAIVKEAFSARESAHPSGQLLVLPRAGIPWKEHLYNIEDEAGLPAEKKILYVIYPEKEEPGSKWRIQAVSKDLSSFENRKSLPESWRGVRDAELDALLGDNVEDGAVFVHASGFTGGHKTEAGVRAMAALALAS
ncbi:MYG1 protein [Exophiala dermatitidis]